MLATTQFILVMSIQKEHRKNIFETYKSYAYNADGGINSDNTQH